MKVKPARLGRSAILLLTNVIIIVILLHGLEFYLRLTDPLLNLPFDTRYYKKSYETYKHYNLKTPQEGYYTWGQLVVNNRFGFRERDFVVPKPAGVCRIMVLGDSLTWGPGLAPEERYTNKRNLTKSMVICLT